jgi:RHS repeat-associated protein
MQGAGLPAIASATAGGVGGLLAVRIHDPQPTIFYPSYDGNGNIVAWTVSGATASTCRREYDSFGNILIEHGTPPCAIGFSTKIEDPESGLLYYGYRYLSPPLGRWISKDPIEERGGINLYGFVGNDGVSRWDILGLDPGDDFTTFDAAYDDARGYVRRKAEESLDLGWKQFGDVVGIPTVTKTDRDAIFDRMMERQHAEKLQETTKSDMAIYQIGKINNTLLFVLIIGREKAASVYCYNRAGKAEFSYNFSNGSVINKDAYRKDPMRGMVTSEEARKLFSKKEHKGMPIVRHMVFVHSHNGLAGFKNLSRDGTRPMTIPRGNPWVSDSDKTFANENYKEGVRVLVATEIDGNDYEFYPRDPGPDGSVKVIRGVTHPNSTSDSK